MGFVWLLFCCDCSGWVVGWINFGGVVWLFVGIIVVVNWGGNWGSCL